MLWNSGFKSVDRLSEWGDKSEQYCALHSQNLFWEKFNWKILGELFAYEKLFHVVYFEKTEVGEFWKHEQRIVLEGTIFRSIIWNYSHMGSKIFVRYFNKLFCPWNIGVCWKASKTEHFAAFGISGVNIFKFSICNQILMNTTFFYSVEKKVYSVRFVFFEVVTVTM